MPADSPAVTRTLRPAARARGPAAPAARIISPGPGCGRRHAMIPAARESEARRGGRVALPAATEAERPRAAGRRTHWQSDSDSKLGPPAGLRLTEAAEGSESDTVLRLEAAGWVPVDRRSRSLGRASPARRHSAGLSASSRSRRRGSG